MRELGAQQLNELLSALGDHLAAGDDSAAIVIVGGGALAARGWVDRVTSDVDVIAQGRREGDHWILVAPDPLPVSLRTAIERVARDYGLPGDWLNTVVGKQWEFGLPEGFSEEVEWAAYGCLHVGFAGRRSLLALKLFAAVDRGPESVHVQDLLALAPSDAELDDAAAWVAAQDATEGFGIMLEQILEYVRGHR